MHFPCLAKGKFGPLIFATPSNCKIGQTAATARATLRGGIPVSSPGMSGDNRILANLPSSDHRALLAHLEPMRLDHKQVLYGPGDPVTHVIFPRSGMISLLAVMRDRSEIEVATVGREGLVGLRALWGDPTTPQQIVVQVPGEALRVEASILQAELSRRPSLRDALGRYTLVFLTQIAQSVACNGLHSVKERCCRWLLLTRDRVDNDQFPLTQDFLAKMLGVRRAGVADAARQLQKAGLIEYTRGTITIRNRKGLEAAACECYRVVRDEWEQRLASK